MTKQDMAIAAYKYFHNVNIKSTDDLKWFKWAELGITGKNNGKKLYRLTKAFLALNHVKLHKDKDQKCHLRDIETKWKEAATNCGMDVIVAVWNFTTLQ